MIAICSMVRKPFNFDTWIEYHLSLGVDYIFLRVEDTPELKETLDKYPNVFAYYDNKSNKKNNYWTQMNRQNNLIETIKDYLNKFNINWLIHIDSDELICNKKSLNDIFNSVDSKYDVVKFQNYEAIYDNDSLENPFFQTKKFKSINKLAYDNGKSASRVKNLKSKKSDSPVGEIFCPHATEGEVFKLHNNIAVILHFESATFDIWYEKFLNDSDMDDEAFEKIPFNFYKKSIEIIKNGDKQKAREYYNKMKVNVNDPHHVLYWTPQLKDKNINWSINL